MLHSDINTLDREHLSEYGAYTLLLLTTHLLLGWYLTFPNNYM